MGQPGAYAGDPVSRLYLEYHLGFSFSRLAAELYLAPSALLERLDALPVAIGAAAVAGSMDRSTLEAVYVNSLCALQPPGSARPVECP
jgi:hypothetical protein